MPLARLITALHPQLVEPMMTHEFIDEEADLACQDLSDWEKLFFFFGGGGGGRGGIKSVRTMEMNQIKKGRRKGRNRGRNNFR